MKTIAILAATREEQEKVKNVIAELAPPENEYKFNMYRVYHTHKADMLAEIAGDMGAGCLDLLIISDWIDTDWEEFSCAEIIGFCHQAVPDLPVIITTEAEVSEDDLENIIPSRVYPNSIFLDPKNELAGKMVAEIVNILA